MNTRSLKFLVLTTSSHSLTKQHFCRHNLQFPQEGASKHLFWCTLFSIGELLLQTFPNHRSSPFPISTQIWSESNNRFEIIGLTKLLLSHFLTINYSLARILQQVFSAIQEHVIPTQSLDSEQILLDC